MHNCSQRHTTVTHWINQISVCQICRRELSIKSQQTGQLSDSPAPGHHGQSQTVNQNPCSDHATSQTSVTRRTASGKYPVFNFVPHKSFLIFFCVSLSSPIFSHICTKIVLLHFYSNLEHLILLPNQLQLVVTYILPPWQDSAPLMVFSSPPLGGNWRGLLPLQSATFSHFSHNSP